MVVVSLPEAERGLMGNSRAVLLYQATLLGIGKADNAELSSTGKNLLFCLSALSTSICFTCQGYIPPHTP